MDYEPTQPPQVPNPAPPVQPTAPISNTRTSWPIWIGVFLCIFGGIGLLQRLAGVVFTAIMPALPLPPEAKMTGTLWVLGLVLSIVTLPLAVVHLIAGIQTLRRRPSARFWIVVFFIYAVLAIIPGSIFQWYSMHHQMQQASQQSGSPAGMAAFGAGFAVAMVALTILFALIWPTFLLIWYSRDTIREEIRGWGAQ